MIVSAYCLDGGKIVEKKKDLLFPSTGEVQIKAVLTGICGSDTAVYTGKEHYLGDEMWGHEGVGIVEQVGADVTDFHVGDKVATYWHPAFWSYYNVPAQTVAPIPVISPEYILQPLACPLNAIVQTGIKWQFADVLILGSGFMAYLWSKYLGDWFMGPSKKRVVANHNHRMFIEKTNFVPVDASSVEESSYDVVVLCSTEQTAKGYYELAAKAARVGGCIIHYTTPRQPVTSNFFQFNWKNLNVLFPSPRHPGFSEVHRKTVAYAPGLGLATSYKGWPLEKINEAFECESKKRSFRKSYIRMLSR